MCSENVFRMKTLIYEKELEHLSGWAQEYPDLETGGDLFGFWTHSGSPIIQLVLGPGPKSRHNFTSFYQDRDFLINAGEIIRNAHGLQHIGEWHSHHQLGLAEPSGGDEMTVFNALEKYNFPKFLLCVANLQALSKEKAEKICNKKKYTVTVGSFLFITAKPNYQTSRWVVLPGSSPIRSALKDSLKPKPYKEFFISPALSENWKVDRNSISEDLETPISSVQVSESLWYSDERGRTLLKEIYDDFNETFKDCKMLRTESEQIVFVFNNYSHKWRVEFPDNFPHSFPMLQINNEKPFQIQNWKSSQKLVSTILSYIDLYNRKENSYGLDK